MKLTHARAVVLMVAVTLMWSIAGVVTRQLAQARGFEVTFWRSLFTALSLAVMLPWLQRRRSPEAAFFAPAAWRHRLLWISGLCWAVMFTAFMMALTLTSVANVLITMAVGPMLTALGAQLFTREKLPSRTWGAIVLACAGMAWMYAADLDPKAFGGMLVALCVPLASAFQWNLVQSSGRGEGRPDLLRSVLLGSVISALFTLPLSFPWQASHADLAWLALLGLVQLAIPCCLSVWCASILKAPEVSLLALLEVIFGIALAWLGAGEAPGGRVLMGGGLVLLALAANEWWGWKQMQSERT